MQRFHSLQYVFRSLVIFSYILFLPLAVQASVDKAWLKQIEAQKLSTRPPLLRQPIIDKLNQIQKQIEEEKQSEASTIINTLLADSDNLRSYERAQLLNLQAYLAFEKQDYKQVISLYKQLLLEKELTQALFNNSAFALAHIYYMQEELDSALALTELWLSKNQKANASVYELLGQIYYQKKDYEKGIENIDKAVAMYRTEKLKPKENWYRLLLAMYFELGNEKQVISLLELLVQDYSKKTYWIQLAAMYGQSGRQDLQLSTMDLAYFQGFVDTENEYLNLAYLYLDKGVPFKAAKLLNEGFEKNILQDNSEHRKLLANAWSLSQELKLSIVELEKAAALSEEGELFFRLGQIYLSDEQYENAASALEKSISKGQLKRLDNAQALLGISYIFLKEWGKAQLALNLAKQDERSADLVKQWQAYLDNALAQSS